MAQQPAWGCSMQKCARISLRRPPAHQSQPSASGERGPRAVEAALERVRGAARQPGDTSGRQDQRNRQLVKRDLRLCLRSPLLLLARGAVGLRRSSILRQPRGPSVSHLQLWAERSTVCAAAKRCYGGGGWRRRRLHGRLCQHQHTRQRLPRGALDGCWAAAASSVEHCSGGSGFRASKKLVLPLPCCRSRTPHS